MKLSVIAFSVASLVTTTMPSVAQDASRADEVLATAQAAASQVGGPFCTDRVELQDYRSATASADYIALETLDSCSTFKEPLEVKVIGIYPDSDVVKARVYVANGSVDGFTTRTALALR